MSLLLNKGKIGNLELKNRVVMPPMCMYKSDNSGELKDFHMFHYTSRAMADVGLIIVEATSVEPKGRISSFDLGLWDDSLIENHKKMNEKLHLFGAKSSIQLAHAGRKSEVVDDICVAPSSIAFVPSIFGHVKPDIDIGILYTFSPNLFLKYRPIVNISFKFLLIMLLRNSLHQNFQEHSVYHFQLHLLNHLLKDTLNCQLQYICKLHLLSFELILTPLL